METGKHREILRRHVKSSQKGGRNRASTVTSAVEWNTTRPHCYCHALARVSVRATTVESVKGLLCPFVWMQENQRANVLTSPIVLLSGYALYLFALPAQLLDDAGPFAANFGRAVNGRKKRLRTCEAWKLRGQPYRWFLWCTRGRP